MSEEDPDYVSYPIDQPKLNYLPMEVRVRYDYKNDIIRITGDDDHKELLMTLKKGTPSESILREELEQCGIIRTEEYISPSVDIAQSIVTGFGGSYRIVGKSGSGKSVFVQAVMNTAKIADIPVYTFLTPLSQDTNPVDGAVSRMREFVHIINSGKPVRSIVFIDLDSVVGYDINAQSQEHAKSFQERVEFANALEEVLAVRVGSGLSIIISSQASTPFFDKEGSIDTFICFDSDQGSLRGLSQIIASKFGISRDKLQSRLDSLRQFQYLANSFGEVVVGTTVIDGIVDITRLEAHGKRRHTDV